MPLCHAWADLVAISRVYAKRRLAAGVPEIVGLKRAHLFFVEQCLVRLLAARRKNNALSANVPHPLEMARCVRLGVISLLPRPSTLQGLDLPRISPRRLVFALLLRNSGVRSRHAAPEYQRWRLETMLRARFCTAPAAKQASGCCAATSQNLPKPLSARLHAQHAPRSFVQPSASHDEAHPTPVASTRPQGWSNTVTAGTVHAPAKQAATNGNSTQPAASRLRVAVDVDEGELMLGTPYCRNAMPLPALNCHVVPGLLFVCAVLGAFVATLNRFCMENYSMDYNVKDYWVYEFAKASVGLQAVTNLQWAQPGRAGSVMALAKQLPCAGGHGGT